MGEERLLGIGFTCANLKVAWVSSRRAAFSNREFQHEKSHSGKKQHSILLSVKVQESLRDKAKRKQKGKR